MRLDVYRSCSRSEKRDVLEAFWRSNERASSRINDAAIQYGPLAILSLVVVVFELALIVATTLGRGYAWGWLVAAFEILVLASLVWSIVRWRALKTGSMAP